MIPIGQHIKISKPPEQNKSFFILEKGAVMKAAVLEVSPDIEVPFVAGDEVNFYTNREIVLEDEYFMPLEMVLMYYKTH